MSQLNSAFDNLVATGRLPGVGAVVLSRSGETIYSHATGTINANDSAARPFTADTQLFIWSLTKLVTSIAVLQLLEKGVIESLDDPIEKYMPDEANTRVITGFDEHNLPVTRPAKGKVRLIHLLTHTSGHVYDLYNHLMHQYRVNTGENAQIGDASGFFDVFLESDPGEKYTGQKLPEYIKDNITDPLRMYDTSSSPRDDDWLRTHIRGGDGKLVAVEAMKLPKDPDYFGGGYQRWCILEDWESDPDCRHGDQVPIH